MSWSTWRTGAAAVAATGVIAGFIVNVARAERMHQDLGLVLANYFSLFTIVCSTATVVVLLIAARRGSDAPADAVESAPLANALVTTSAAVIILGIVYNALLRGIPSAVAAADPPVVAFLDHWAIETLHVVLPIFIVVDAVFGPRRRRLRWSALSAVVGIPLLWAVYTMARGPLVPAPDGSTAYWYPYPFLDPNGPTGYATPLTYIAAIAIAFVLTGGALILLTHRHRHVPRHDTARASRLRPRVHG
ncbi:Pr6Pr family membrane protein [Microbacterium mangrovi]|uniref:Pr6Pr family membrane protein n=1 Tax=Microbacterium mangrovi TaxID=1348253 RepID=UPI00068A252F|nr:Pr6Pr family membrane protein [Microbacterium mangrovi]